MDPTFLSIILFLIETIAYYFLKPVQKLENDPTYNDDEAKGLGMKKITYLLVYFFVIVCTQFFINAVIIINKCGGSASNNIGIAGLMTLIPWTFIFGSVIIILLMWPGFKSVFANIIGYFYVSSSAQALFEELLINNDIENIKDLAANSEPSTDGNSNKSPSVKTGEALIKLFGDPSTIINQIVPENFNEYWELLTPLIKPDLPEEKKTDLQNKLLHLTISRDNAGESCWYLYTAILLISIVQYNITSKGCVNTDPDQMAAQHQAFLDEEAVQLGQKNTTQYI